MGASVAPETGVACALAAAVLQSDSRRSAGEKLQMAARDMAASLRIVLGGLALVILVPAFAQTVYTWKDAKGVTHYSDAPPPAGATKREVHTTAGTPAPTVVKTAPKAASTAAAVPVVDPAVVAAQEKQRAQACKQAQANLAILKGSFGVAVDKDGDGKNDMVLDAKQREQETQNMQASVDANCGNG
jgi:hypothetical protein